PPLLPSSYIASKEPNQAPFLFESSMPTPWLPNRRASFVWRDFVCHSSTRVTAHWSYFGQR
ncbi:hypothetical protein Csa_008618, partial [Cucumis sativus]